MVTGIKLRLAVIGAVAAVMSGMVAWAQVERSARIAAEADATALQSRLNDEEARRRGAELALEVAVREAAAQRARLREAESLIRNIYEEDGADDPAPDLVLRTVEQLRTD